MNSNLTVITEEEEEHVVSCQELKSTGLVRMREDDHVDSIQTALHGFSFSQRPSKEAALSKAKIAKSYLISPPISSNATPTFTALPPSSSALSHSRNVPPPLKITTTSAAAGAAGRSLLLSKTLQSPLITPIIRFSPIENPSHAMVTTDTQGNISSLNETMKALSNLQNFIGSSILTLFCDDYVSDQRNVLSRSMQSTGDKVLECGKIVRIKKGDDSVAVSVWVKKKCTEEDSISLIWVFQLVDECVCECKVDLTSKQVIGYSDLFVQLFQVGSAEVYLDQILPGIRNNSAEFLSCLRNDKYHGAKSIKGVTFPVIVKVTSISSSSTSQVANLQIISMPDISGAMVFSSENNDKLVSCSSAIAKYLFGYSTTTIADKTASALIPMFSHVKELLAVATETSSALVSASVLNKFVLNSPSPFTPNENSNVSSKTISHPLQVVHRDGSLFDVELQLKNVQSKSSGIKFYVWVSFRRPIQILKSKEYDPFSSPVLGNFEHQEEEEYFSKQASTLINNQQKEPLNILQLAPLAESNFKTSKTTIAEDKTKIPEDKDGIKRKERKIDDYEIVQKLGEGAFGHVHLGKFKHDPEQRLVVIKYITKKRILLDTWVNDQELGIIPLEVQILNYLRHYPHPNITSITLLFSDKENIYIEMSLHGSGMDLFDYIEYNQSMSDAEIKFIFKQVCSGVEHLHKHKIVHRVIDQYSRIKLIDFGSAAWVIEGKPFTVFCGTVDYASPEILIGRPYSGYPQDMWTLGILLYTLVYRESPFFNMDEILEARLRIPFVLSSNNLDLMKRLLSKQPMNRPTITEVLSHSWLK